jgi:predicted nucleic acid-binding protein
MPYLLDANVLCESSRPRPDGSVLQWLAEHDGELQLSALTVGEMIKGIHLLDQGRRRRQLEAWYARIERWAAGRILPLDVPVMRRWGTFYAKHQLNGRKLDVIDSLLAATAIEHQLTLVTRNTAHFPDEVPMLNPWAR